MSESRIADQLESLGNPTDSTWMSWGDWPTELRTYDDETELGWDSIINPNWREPIRNDEIREGIVSVPDSAETISTRTWATVFRNQERAFRVINWEKLTERSDQQYARNDVRYKVLVAKSDNTNLTPSIFAYDPETCSIEMEFVEGIPLSKLKTNIKIPPDVIERFFDRLDRFHKLGLFHGDLSDGSHYIITPAGEIRLIDPSFMVDIETVEQVEQIQEMDRAVARNVLNRFSETRIE